MKETPFLFMYDSKTMISIKFRCPIYKISYYFFKGNKREFKVNLDILKEI